MEHEEVVQKVRDELEKVKATLREVKAHLDSVYQVAQELIREVEAKQDGLTKALADAVSGPTT